MAASAHYIRTIHTSFTAAHPHSSSAWASHASTTSVTRAQAHSNLILALTGNTPSSSYSPPLSVSKFSPGLSAPPTGRRRSASIRVAPPAYAQRMQSQRVKFDPFADELEASPTPTSLLYYSPNPSAARSTRPAAIHYTIQLTPAASSDIQKLHQQQSQQPQQQQHIVRQSKPRASSPQSQPVQRVSTPTPARSPTPSPTARASALKEKEARSKIVAGILLNRVHAVGKPLRRRTPAQPRTYVPSSLSTCVSVGA